MTPIYAQRIREVRQAAGMTQTEFAMAIGTTKNQLSKYELGTQDTPTKIIIAVCNRFTVDANWLLGINAVNPNSVMVITNNHVNEVMDTRVREYLNKLHEKAEAVSFIDEKMK